MKIKDQSLLSCWPDGFSRYYSVSNILRIVFDQAQVNILDVGGDSQWMAKFLDSEDLLYDLNIVDMREADFTSNNPHVHYTQGDFFKIDSNKYRSDAVINTDVLEHIPKNLKIPFVNRCIELAKTLVVISAPQDDHEVTAAEEQINAYYLNVSGNPQRWLKEHFELGKPSPTLIESAIQKTNYPYLCIDTNNLENWFTCFTLNFINSEVIGLEGMDNFNRFYNRNLHKNGDFTGKPYRKIYIIFKDEALFKKHYPQLTSFFTPDSSERMKLLAELNTLLVENMHTLALADKEMRKTNERLARKLSRTQANLITTKQELSSIKESKTYRYANKVRNIVRR